MNDELNEGAQAPDDAAIDWRFDGGDGPTDVDESIAGLHDRLAEIAKVGSDNPVLAEAMRLQLLEERQSDRLSETQQQMEELAAPTLRIQIAERVAEGLTGEAREHVMRAISRLDTTGLAALQKDRDALEDLRYMAEGVHSRRSGNGMNAPASSPAAWSPNVTGDIEDQINEFASGFGVSYQEARRVVLTRD